MNELNYEHAQIIRRTERRMFAAVWIILFIFAVLFGGLLLFSMFGCSVPIKLPITSTTGLTAFESGLWGYQQDLRNPDHAITLPACQGVAAREYYQLKADGYNACIMAGYKMGVGHVQASAMRNGIPIDLMSMRVTHMMTESQLWRIQGR